MEKRRVSRMGRVVPIILVVSLVASSAWAAVQRERLAVITTQALGTFSVYDYSSGVQTIRDGAADWDAGTYVQTQKTPIGGSVRLTRRGDVAPDPVNVWWDTTWRTRRCWSATNATAAVVTSGRTILTFDATADVANSWMQPGGVDVRALTGGTAPTLLNFNAAPFVAATASYTVEIPPLAAGASQTVCLYWGNPVAVSASAILTSPAGTPLYRMAAGTNVADPSGNWFASTALPAGVTTLSNPLTNPISTYALLPPMVSAQYYPGPPAVPAGTPVGIFTNVTRIGIPTGPPSDFSEWKFVVPALTPIEVRVFVADDGTVTNRSYDLTVDGSSFLTNFNPPTLCLGGGLLNSCGHMRSFSSVSDGSVDLRFSRGNGLSGAARRQLWSAIEIRTAPPAIVNLTPTGGIRREGLVQPTGTWTSPVVDTTSAASIYGTVRPSVLASSLSVGRSVTASPVSVGSVLAAGNDGAQDGGAYISTTTTEPFWEVDLGVASPVSRVDVFTTPYAMANSVTVFVSPASLAAYPTPAAAIAAGVPYRVFSAPIASNNMDSVFPPGTTGRYVRIWSSGTGVVSLTEVEVTSGLPADVSIQIATATSAAGPWNYVGPDGTAATSYASVGAFPYSADNRQFYRVQAVFQSPAGIGSPTLERVQTNAGLVTLPRAADGFHQFAAPDIGVNWTVRIKTPLPNVTAAATATLQPQGVSTWGASQISGYLDRNATQCCAANDPFFSTSGATTSQTPVALFDVGGFRNLSVLNNRLDDLPADHEQIVDIALSSTIRIQVPLRRTGTSSSLPVNIALGKTASQSSEGFGGVPSRANDGNTDGQYFTGSSVMHTLFEVRPWWQVNLVSQRVVNQVEVYNRLDCCTNRLTGFYIVVSANPLPATFSLAALSAPGVAYQEYSGGAFTTPRTLVFPGGVTGQYVRLWSKNTDYLHVAEVRVIGPS